MSVGEIIAQHTGAKLLYNHLTIDPLTQLFEFASPAFERVNEGLRFMILHELANAGISAIITVGWRLDVPEDGAIVEQYCAPYRERGARVAFLELRASDSCRVARNSSENRRQRKKLDWASNEFIENATRRYRYSSDGGFAHPDELVILDSEGLSLEETVRRAMEALRLPKRTLHSTRVTTSC